MTDFKRSILIFIILFLSNTVIASDIKWGVKAGITYSNLDTSYTQKSYKAYKIEAGDYYWGTFFSFYGNRNIYNFIDLQLEANYNQKGMQKNSKDVNINTKMTFGVMEVVTLLKFDFKKIKPYMGFFYGIILNKKYISEEKGKSDKITTGNGDFNREPGIIFGFELNYKSYLIDFRFNKGVGIFYDRTDYGDGDYYYNHSRQFIVSLGYEF